MYAVIAPAKTFDMTPGKRSLPATQPALIDQATSLIATLAELDERQFSRLMKASDDVSRSTQEATKALEIPFTKENAVQSALAFAGDVHKALKARSLTTADLKWAQTRIGTMSGLFGLLRPLDLVQPHRLEMSASLQTSRGRGLYAFWGDLIARQIRDHMAKHKDKTLLNLASAEYIRAVPRSALRVPVITPVFEEVEGFRSRSIAVHTKKARGWMARYIIENRIETLNELKAFDVGRYRFDHSASRGDKMVFKRSFQPMMRSR